MGASIKDRDVRRALITLEDEIVNYEATIDQLDGAIDDHISKISFLEEEVKSLEAKIKQLEEALAEAYLTNTEKTHEHT